MTGHNPHSLVEIRTAPNETQAAIIQSVLTDAGIESWTQKASGFDYLGLGTLGFAVTSVTVRAQDIERARAALDANRQDSVDIDWSEVDVGEAEDEASSEIASAPRVNRENKVPMARRFPCGALLFWITAAGVAIALLAGLLLLVRRRATAPTVEAPRYVLPEAVTPFNVIALLRRLLTDPERNWSATQSSELAVTIKELEAHYFSHQRNGNPEPDLAGIGRRWIGDQVTTG